MAKQPNQKKNSLFGEQLITGEAFASEMREKFVRMIVDSRRHYMHVGETVEALKNMADDMTPFLAENLWGSEVSAWLFSYEWNADRLPEWLIQHLADSGGPPVNFKSFFGDAMPERIAFPKIEKAAESLMKRGIMQRSEFDEVASATKARTFTVAGDITEGTISRVRDILVDLTVEGPTLKEFEETIEEKLHTSLLGPAHIETVYRTNLQAAYRDGREAVVSNPIIASIFPYQEYIPIGDARVRDEHEALGKLGLSGTGVYRRDDPFWDRFTPPWDFNCRCGVNLLTIDAAARKGVQEAIDWLESGDPPENPEYRDSKIPFNSKSGFGQRTGVVRMSVTDAVGHVHGDDGRFVSGSGGSDRSKARFASQMSSDADPSPAYIEPLNETDPDKVAKIAKSMRADGYTGRPLLVFNDGANPTALTGSHRLDAAKLAGLETIPVIQVQDHTFSLENEGGEIFGELLASAIDDEDRLAVAVEFSKSLPDDFDDDNFKEVMLLLEVEEIMNLGGPE